ncbi:MAG: folate-binding protein YgfZ [Proteobacteria bacterium]|nr:folate-binding protein YgfZ [Pseudomonadota bacterium]
MGKAMKYIVLDDRGLLAVGGAEARPFLQGLISNDIDKVSAKRAIYATLLTPQGKFLHDFFIAGHGGALIFDSEAPRLADLERRLLFYRLRAEVTIEDVTGRYLVAALIGDGAAAALGLGEAEGDATVFAGGIAYADPRLRAMGARAVLPREGAAAALEAAGFASAPAEDYERLRLAHGIPDGSRDIPVDKGFLLENGIDDLAGVDFDKGCYVGQELTTRTKHRAKVRKRLFRVDVDGPLPAPGTPIMLGEKEAGTMRSGLDGVGLALLRTELVDAASGEPLTAGDARLTPVKPEWASY